MNAQPFNAKIDAPVLSAIAQEILLLVQNDARLREIWARNAPTACYFESGTLTNTAAQFINEARSGNGEIFYQLMVVFDGTAGAGNYRIDGLAAGTAVPAGGFPLDAGGGTLIITGHNNIRNFSMIAQGATTMPFTRVLFK